MSTADRIRQAQDGSKDGFDAALREIRSGHKRGHWIWYVFPQLEGLGTSQTARNYSLAGLAEATDYLRDRILRNRLLVITCAVNDGLRSGARVDEMMGGCLDARKLVSSLTLFGEAATTLATIEQNEQVRELNAVIADVLARTTTQGFPRCTFTLGRLSGARS